MIVIGLGAAAAGIRLEADIGDLLYYVGQGRADSR